MHSTNQTFKTGGWVKFALTCLCLPILYTCLSNVILWLVELSPSLSAIWSKDKGNIFLVLLPVTFIHLILAPWLYFVYKMPYARLFSQTKSPIWRNIFVSTNILAIAFIISELSFYVLFRSQVSMVWRIDWANWFLQIIPLFIMVLLQVSAEEAFVRGYLQRSLASLTNKKVVFIGIPSFIWAFAHWNTFNNLPMQLSFVFLVFVLGLVLGDVADRTKALFGSIAIHFAFNFFNIGIYGNTSRSTSLQILKMDMQDLSDLNLAFYYLLMAVSLAVIYLLCRNRLSLQESSNH